MHDPTDTSSRELANQLSTQFGSPFDAWQAAPEGWACGDDPRGTASAELAAWFDSLAASGAKEPSTTRLADGLWVACPVGGGRVVAGVVALTPEQMAGRLAAAAVEHGESKQQVVELRELSDDYANKLADSFEELAFFRRLASHVEFCDATRRLEEVAEGVLPSMRRVAGLEGIALVLADEHAPGQVGAITLHNGDTAADDDAWAEAVRAVFARQSGVAVINLNAQHATHDIDFELPGVRNFVLTPISKDGHRYGWLLGVNKIAAAVAGHSSDALGHDEIGSTEASLLEAATVLLATHAANVRLVSEKEDLVVDAIHTLVGVIEAKDAYTCGHSDRVALFAQRIAQELGLPAAKCHEIYLTGLLHDVGKVGVSDDVLLKPGQLTDEELDQIKRHPECGWRLLQRLKPFRNFLDGVLYHHESLDGSGYPEGLAGDDIPLPARVIAVADAWDAMTSDRPYRAGMPWEKAEGILRNGAGRQWDPKVVQAFFSAADDVHNITRTWQDHLRQLLNPDADEPQTRPAPIDASELLTHAVAVDLGL
ncbi:Cyclic di-GMP phosphodiesterase response regulator RpfG [Posidoniimonas polymericola]|uniref:Cyclic di-GMP phosphodiesterase response regulator RpfG n=1 Tax=Posidoniimonas polymericola TaxID=2528002 RepID=A0A5C5YMN9_9BACT|nr:HD-GYP domain-containing protein [Posidoniimonas polymericola]TWT76136.1 Cyclic di-GMP phosphodiesterase response regulator RpfG [Posidoniimonas polymericola]